MLLSYPVIQELIPYSKVTIVPRTNLLITLVPFMT